MENYRNKSFENLDGEVWKEIIGFPGYSVSNLGRVKNAIGIILSQCFDREYLILGLTKIEGNEKVRKTLRVHRIVAEAFIKNDNPYLKNTIDHKNDIKTDNRVENLQWMTLKENKRKSYKLGYNKYKTTPDMVREIRKLKKKGMKQRDIAKKIGLSPTAICEILSGKKWSYID